MAPPEHPAAPLSTGRAGSGTDGPPSRPAWRTLRAHWEVAAAAAILLVVLAVIDVGAVGEPRLVLSLGPLVFLIVAALARLTPTLIVAWSAGWAALAVTSGEPRYAGLAYPAAAAALLLVLQRVRGGRR